MQCKLERARLGWSQTELALRSGINKAYLSEFENGIRALDEDRLMALEQALGGIPDIDEIRQRHIEQEGYCATCQNAHPCDVVRLLKYFVKSRRFVLDAQ